MGSGLDIICSGDDVLNELNRVFGDPESERYKKAQRNNIFDQVPNASDNGLVNSQPISTDVHTPEHGGHVHTARAHAGRSKRDQFALPPAGSVTT
jgi:hypothetical protein